MPVWIGSVRAVPRPVRQSETDACPGALRLHAAADGPLARVRLPGGMLSGAQLAELGAIAAELGDGHLELTSRANVQLRALTTADPTALATRLAGAGLLPSLTHEVVRNIAAPPLAGPELRTLVRELDEALCADPALAALPGRFLFAIGPVPLAADVAAVPAGSSFAIRLAGHDAGRRVEPAGVVTALLEAARAFLRLRAGHEPPPWRLAELPDGPAQVAAAMGPPGENAEATDAGATDAGSASAGATDAGSASAGATDAGSASAGATDAGAAPTGRTGAGAAGARSAGGVDGGALVGAVAQVGGLFAVGAMVPLGRLDGGQVALLARARRLVLTPSRGVLIPDLSGEEAERWAADLAAAGLPVEAESRWFGVTACAGRPGCAKSLADVRADALAATRHVDGLPAHWIGCARGCGSPSGPHVRVEATPAGYQMTRVTSTGTPPIGTAKTSTPEPGSAETSTPEPGSVETSTPMPGSAETSTPNTGSAVTGNGLADIVAAARKG
jgi:precorrin-3B synthase